MKQHFRQRLLSGELLVGSMVTLPSPEVAELFSMHSLDWLFLDTEHGPYGVLECQRMIQAVAGRSACLIRVEENSEKAIKKALDIGSDGIIVPKVNSAKEAEQVVKAARYAPVGDRGVGYSRAHGYGNNFKDYVGSANEKITIVIQIEHAEGVKHIDEIVRVEGVDAILIGPFDLSASLGRMGEVNAPEVQEAITQIERAAKNAGIPLGYFSLNSEALKPIIDKGYNLIACGTDTSYLNSGVAGMMKDLKG